MNRLRNNLIAGLIVLVLLIGVASQSIAATDPIVTDNTNVVTTTGTQTTTVKSPPPSAIAPAFGGSNSDLCTISSSGSVQTQILGISMGATYTEAMMDAGTPCPIDGMIGNEAKAAWEVRQDLIPMPEGEDEITIKEKRDKVLSIMAGIAGAFLVF